MQDSKPLSADPALKLVATRLVAGYLYEFRQPLLLADVQLRDPGPESGDLSAIDRVLQRVLPDFALSPAASAKSDPLLDRLIRATERVLTHAGMPAFSGGVVLGRRAGAPAIARLALPALHGEHLETLRALDWALKLINACFDAGQDDSVCEVASAQALATLPAILARIGQAAPRGMNSLRFLQAAHDAGVPWRRIYANVYQFGQGARARWLDSSFTDATSTIGGNLARSKRGTAALLRSAGIPVPEHARAVDAEQAVQLAERLGYPVVVKPGDLDGGQGVSAGLRQAAAVRKAFGKARALSNEVLVEKHVAGNDYRLQVFQGQVFWISHRIPGGVTGDGLRSVAALLAELNSNPKRSEPGSAALLKRIPLDDEALELLVEQDLGPDAVPAAGRTVPLRRAANVASGGTIVPMLEQAHPDNLALAARAASVLRLDIAGVDLLIPDIRRSWCETGATICEVNAQPQLSPTLPPYLLEKMLRGQGRIPVVVVFGSMDPADHQGWLEPLLGRIRAGDAGRKRCIGLATPAGVWIDREVVIAGRAGVYQGGLALATDPRVDMMLLQISDYGWQDSGLPFDRFDALVLTGTPPAGGKPHEAGRWRALERSLERRCTGPVFRTSTGVDISALMQSLESVFSDACR